MITASEQIELKKETNDVIKEQDVIMKEQESVIKEQDSNIDVNAIGDVIIPLKDHKYDISSSFVIRKSINEKDPSNWFWEITRSPQLPQDQIFSKAQEKMQDFTTLYHWIAGYSTGLTTQIIPLHSSFVTLNDILKVYNGPVGIFAFRSAATLPSITSSALPLNAPPMPPNSVYSFANLNEAKGDFHWNIVLNLEEKIPSGSAIIMMQVFPFPKPLPPVETIVEYTISHTVASKFPSHPSIRFSSAFSPSCPVLRSRLLQPPRSTSFKDIVHAYRGPPGTFAVRTPDQPRQISEASRRSYHWTIIVDETSTLPAPLFEGMSVINVIVR